LVRLRCSGARRLGFRRVHSFRLRRLRGCF
jgi:hypothetical protein